MNSHPIVSNPLTLIAFHHAGGSPHIFGGWRALLGPMRLVPVSLPGRNELYSYQNRSAEEFLTDLDDALDPHLRGPYAIYGHSMGATVGHAWSEFRRARRRSVPEILVAGAAVGPSAAVPAEVLAEVLPEVTGRALTGIEQLKQRQLRADLRLLTTLREYSARSAAMPFPIHVYRGDRDPLSRLDIRRGWQNHTRSGCTVTTVAGGHFFHRDDKASFVEQLRRGPLATLPAAA